MSISDPTTTDFLVLADNEYFALAALTNIWSTTTDNICFPYIFRIRELTEKIRVPHKEGDSLVYVDMQKE
jgi:hypothetical protein